MLLPSDVARLVLGYLQEEGLTATSQAFIHESPNLKEYADHTIGDGTVPACVFSIFGKSLTTILNEYMATKTKESYPEVPAVMTSLWKKLDYTLNQIKSLQNTPNISACQRNKVVCLLPLHVSAELSPSSEVSLDVRSRVGLARQRSLAVASSGAIICSSVSETSSSIISPAHTSHSMLGPSTPACYTAQHTRTAASSIAQQQIHDIRLNTPRDSPVQMIVSEHRLNQGPMSPGRRKWDTPRKRGGAVSGSSGPGRCATASSSLNAEPQLEEAVDETFPQLVIQSARDKILGDRSLQEKLAENINKILASDPVPQTSKTSSTTLEADPSIDEILGLQGEIHMSDDAIQDILEQTESDPAFQALYDLFDYNKTRFNEGEPEDGDISCSPEESDTAGPSPTVRPVQNDDPGTTQGDGNALDTAPMTVKMRAGQERKIRKATAPTVFKKTILSPRGRASRIENSSARLLVSHGEHREASSAAVDSNRKEKGSLLDKSAFATPMDVDEPLNTPPPPSDSTASQEPAPKDSTSNRTAIIESTALSLSGASTAFPVPEETSASNVDKGLEHKQAQGSEKQPATVPLPMTSQNAFLSPAQVDLSSTPTVVLPHASVSSSEGVTQPVFTFSVTSESSSFTSASACAPSTATPGSSTSCSTSAVHKATPASSTSATYCAPAATAPDPQITNHTSPSKAAADSNIVSLKIIISDTQDEESSSDPALTQAISSISGDKIPTIYLSSPAKSPACPGTPRASMDEAAQAVSGLQSSEEHASPLSSKASSLVASPLTGTSQVQPNYIIQVPLDTTTPALQGSTASYILVTEPPTTDAQTRQVLLSAGVSKGQPLPTNQYGVTAVTTPTHSQGFSTGSTLILPSPIKPLMLPVSVVGQNALGKLQMVSNQLVAIPKAVPVQLSETVKTKSPAVAVKWSTIGGTEQHRVGKLVQAVSPENKGQQDTAKGPKHKRILCFDSPAEVQPQTAKTTKATLPPATNTSTSQPVQQTEKVNTQSTSQTKPTILGGNKPKRRVQTVKCPADPLMDGRSMMEVEKARPPQPNQKDSVKKSSRKQDHSLLNPDSQSTSTSRVSSPLPETLEKSESGKRTESHDRKQNHGKDGDVAKAKDSHSSRSLSSESALKSGSRKEREETSRKEPAEKAPAKSREGRSEKRTPSQETPNVTANKENEIKGSMQEQQQQSSPSSSAVRDCSTPAVTQSTSNSQSKTPKTPSKTSSLAKQAAEMLHDIQGLHSPSTPLKKQHAGSSDVSLPQTPGSGCNEEETADCARTPSKQKKGKDGEGTPKRPMPPNTPDVPSCSPASEAGSETSINMAAHTLMILSRAAIARTGTPLKDSLRQKEVGEKETSNSKNSKKRKLSSATASPPAKKDRERKKLIDCFPHDLDVDKFLSSLHYDE